MEQYKPGLHLLATFTAPETALQDIEACRALFDRLISANQLVKVGETYHSFPGSGVHSYRLPDGISYLNTYLAGIRACDFRCISFQL